MAQADQTVQNATFPTVRADINNNLAALFSDSSGATAPTVTVAFQDWIDISGTDAVWKKRNAANNAWITIGTFAGAGLSLGGAVPAGSIQYFAGSSAPAGYLKANGANVNRTTYANLFTAIGTTFGVGDGSTTFAVPDLRGEFPRGWDDARGVDSGRAFGSAQDMETRQYKAAFNGSNANSVYVNGPYNGLQQGKDVNSAVNTMDRYFHNWDEDYETRPRNIALLAIIKF